MNQDEILDGNKLIAEFALPRHNREEGIYYIPEFGCYQNLYGDIDWEETFTIDGLKYHSSWDWLMPVVEKIETLFDNGIDVNILSDGVVIQQLRDKIGENLHNPIDIVRRTSAEIDFSTKIEAVYKATIEFIKWYNKKESK